MEKVFNIQREGSTLHVKLGLELTFENSLELQQELMKYRGQDIQKIVFDATDMVYISSSGIRTVILAQKKLAHTIQIEFLNCAEEIYNVLEITGFSNYFTFVDDKRKVEANAKSGASDGNSNEAWYQKIAEAKQNMLDHFAAHNDVVMYQMKLGREDD